MKILSTIRDQWKQWALLVAAAVLGALLQRYLPGVQIPAPPAIQENVK